MAKLPYGMATAVPYDKELYEVTGVEYCAWEDALEACGDDEDAKQWATFDLLMGLGHFVSQPKCERPTKAEGIPRDAAEQQTAVNPGVRDLPYTTIARDESWTQAKILTERNKLVTEREKILKIKEEALKKKVTQTMLGDKAPYNDKAIGCFVMAVALILIALVMACIIVISTH